MFRGKINSPNIALEKEIKKRNQLKNGFFFATKDSIESNTKLTPYKQRKTSSILESANILEVKYIDIPPKTYYKNLTHLRN